MKGLVIGLGSIGKRHLGNLRRLLPEADLTVLRSARPAIDEPTPDATRVVYDFNDALALAPQFAVIASPSPFHIETAQRLAERGTHLCLEKPISNRLDGVSELIATCHQRGLVLMVAYNLRFNAPLRTLRETLLAGGIGRLLHVRAEVGQYLPDWRPQSDYRQVVSARSDLGGGALLELSHEIDSTLWLAGDITRVMAHVRRASDLEIDVEDCADLIVEFASGATGSIHLDMIQRAPMRQYKLIGSEGTLTWDAIAGQVRLYSATSREWTDISPPAPAERNAMYLDELTHFLDCIRTASTPLVTGEDGLRALQVVLAARRSAELHQTCEVSS